MANAVLQILVVRCGEPVRAGREFAGGVVAVQGLKPLLGYSFMARLKVGPSHSLAGVAHAVLYYHQCLTVKRAAGIPRHESDTDDCSSLYGSHRYV